MSQLLSESEWLFLFQLAATTAAVVGLLVVYRYGKQSARREAKQFIELLSQLPPTAVVTPEFTRLAHAIGLTADDVGAIRNTVLNATQGGTIDVDSLIHAAVENARARGLGIDVAYSLATGQDGHLLVEGKVSGPEGSAGFALAGDDIRSEPAVRFQILDAWSRVLRDKGRRALGVVPEGTDK